MVEYFVERHAKIIAAILFIIVFILTSYWSDYRDKIMFERKMTIGCTDTFEERDWLTFSDVDDGVNEYILTFTGLNDFNRKMDILTKDNHKVKLLEYELIKEVHDKESFANVILCIVVILSIVMIGLIF